MYFKNSLKLVKMGDFPEFFKILKISILEYAQNQVFSPYVMKRFYLTHIHPHPYWAAITPYISAGPINDYTIYFFHG